MKVTPPTRVNEEELVSDFKILTSSKALWICFSRKWTYKSKDIHKEALDNNLKEMSCQLKTPLIQIKVFLCNSSKDKCNT
jgi:hypothetical protein